MAEKLGFSGQVAKRFQDNELTPLLALAALLLGLFVLGAVAMLFAVVVATPASAAKPLYVEFELTTYFDPTPTDTFTASGPAVAVWKFQVVPGVVPCAFTSSIRQ